MTILMRIFFKRLDNVTYAHTPKKLDKLAHNLAGWAKEYFKAHPYAAAALIFNKEEI